MTYETLVANVNTARARQAETASAVNIAYEALRKAQYEGIGDVLAAQADMDAAVRADSAATKDFNAASAALRNAAIAAAPNRPASDLGQMFDRKEDGPTGHGW